MRLPRAPTDPVLSLASCLLFCVSISAVQEFVKIARLRLQMSRIGVPPNAEMQARAEGKDPSAVAEEVR